MNKKQTLAKVLECEETEINEIDSCQFEFGDRSYLICDEDEAIEKSSEYICETLWAFRASFLIDFIPSASSLSAREEDELKGVIEEMQEKLCESCNPILKALIGDRLESLINAALCNDPYEYFLAHYDHKVIEENGLLIYRQN